MKPVHRPSGFTLLEVLLALMLFSIAVVALVGAINGMGTASVESRRVREIVAKMESLMVEITRNPPQPTTSSGQSFENTVIENGVTYVIGLAPVELSNVDGQPLPGMFTIKAVAHWTEGGRDQEMSAQSLLYPPVYAPSL